MRSWTRSKRFWRSGSEGRGDSATARSSRRFERIDHLSQSRVVRAGPVDTPAGSTLRKLVEALANVRRQAIDHYGFADVLQFAIAGHATRERLHAPTQIEHAQDLDGLPVRLGLAQPIAMGYRPVLEQALVARQDDPLLGARQLDDLRIAVVVAIERVEAQQAQAAGELAQV